MSPLAVQPSAEALTRLMLLQGMLGQLPDEQSVCDFVRRGLEDVPGVHRVRYLDSGAMRDDVSNPDDRPFRIEYSGRCYGAMVIALDEQALFEPYEGYIRNLCFMVAAVLEERRQHAVIAAHQNELELQVKARTQQLLEEIAVREATERRAVAERARAEQYLAVAEVIIVELDPQGRIEMVNPRGCALLGRALGSLVGQSWVELAIPEDQRAEARRVLGLVAQGQMDDVEYLDNDIVSADGCRCHITWHNISRRSPEGSILGTLSSGLDVTDRKKAEDALAAEKEHLAVTLRSIGDAVITTDIRGCIVLMNAVAERLTGYSQTEASGRPLADSFHIVHEHTRVPCANPVEEVLTSNRVVELAEHTVLIARDGREFLIADSGAPICASDGSVIGVVLVFRDMTEKHKMMEAVQRTERLGALGILAGGIAHDFNNLLGGVYGFVELAQLDTHEPAVRESLAAAAASIGRARGLTRQLLTFAKGGAPIKRVGALGNVIRDAAQFSLSGSKVLCHFELPDNLWNCAFDAAQIGQVVDNLIINAVQAMPNGGHVDISASNAALADNAVPSLRAGPYVRVQVRDTGPGISPTILRRIFDPFFTTKATGSGLGLATSHSIISRHEGAIQAESTPGQGTTFIFYLPAEPQGAADTAVGKKPRHRGSGTILVMDDDSAILEVTTRLLAAMGYSTVTAREGKEAIEVATRLAKGQVRLRAAMLDLTIPGGMGGKEVVNAIRALCPQLPVFVLSGYAHDPIMANPSQHGFCDSLCKPFTAQDLSELFEKHQAKFSATPDVAGPSLRASP